MDLKQPKNLIEASGANFMRGLFDVERRVKGIAKALDPELETERMSITEVMSALENSVDSLRAAKRRRTVTASSEGSLVVSIDGPAKKAPAGQEA